MYVQAYLVYKYRDKEQQPTTLRGGSKYTAANKTATTYLNSSVHNSSSMCEHKPKPPPPPCDINYELNCKEKSEADLQVGAAEHKCEMA